MVKALRGFGSKMAGGIEGREGEGRREKEREGKGRYNRSGKQL